MLRQIPCEAMKIPASQRARAVDLIREADQAGVGMNQLIKALSPIYGKRTVQQLIKEARESSNTEP